MKCPFELPIKKVIKRPYANPYIEDNNDKEICTCQDEAEASYIVQAINSYEKLVKLLRYVNDLPMNESGDYDKNLEWSKETEQALKEAEQPK